MGRLLVWGWANRCGKSHAGGKARGHSARRFGAKAYARRGWTLWKIQALSRHASMAILGYVEEALTERSADWSRDPALALKAGDGDVLEQLEKSREESWAESSSSSMTNNH